MESVEESIPPTRGDIPPKRSRTWILWFLIGMVSILFVINVFLASDYFSDRFTQWVQNYLSEIAGDQVHIKKASVRLIPTRIILEEFSALPLITSRQVWVRISPWSILTQSFVIEEIALQDPLIRVSATDVFPPPFLSKKAGGQKNPAVIVRSLIVQNGHLLYEGEGSVSALNIASFTGTLDPDLFMKQFEIEFTSGRSMLRSKNALFQVTHLTGKGKFESGQVEIKKLEMTFPEGSIYTNGSIGIGATPTVDLFVRAHFPLETFDKPSVAGQPLSGTVAMQFEIKGPIQNPVVRGKGALTQLRIGTSNVGSFSSHLLFQKDRLSLTSLEGALLSGTVAGEVEVAFPSIQYQLDLQMDQIDPRPLIDLWVSLPWVQDGLWGGAFRIAGEGRDLSILEGQGNIHFASHLQKPRPASHSSPGNPSLPSGGKFLPQLLRLMEQGEARWALEEGALNVEEATFQLPKSKVAVQGRATRKTLSLEVSVLSDEVQSLLAPWNIMAKGSGSFIGKIFGDPHRPAVNGKVQLHGSQFKGRPIGEVAIPFRYDGENLILKRGTIHYANGGYRIAGKINHLFVRNSTPSLDLDVSVRNVDPRQALDFFISDFPLVTRTTGKLTLHGKWNRPTVVAHLELEEGRLYEQTFEKGRVSFRVNNKSVRFSKAELVRGESHLIGSGEVGFAGTYKGKIYTKDFLIEEIPRIRHVFTHPSAKVSGELVGEGSFKDPKGTFSLSVSGVYFSGEEIGLAEVEGRVNKKRVTFLGNFPGLHAKGNIRFSKEYPFQMVADFNRLHLDPYLRAFDADKFGKTSLVVSGTMNGEGNFTRLLESRVHLSLSEFSADVEGYSVTNDGRIEIEMADENLRFVVFRLKGEETALNVSGGIALFKEYNLFINGEAGLRLLGLLTDGFTYGRGKAYLVLKVFDQWEDPHLRGGLTLHDGQIRTARLEGPLHLTELSVVFNEKQLILESLEAEMGGGRLSGSGKIDVERFVPTRFGFLLNVENLRVNLLEGLSSSISGTLLYQGTPKSKELKGDVQILRALYDKRLDLKAWLLAFQKEQVAVPELPGGFPVVGDTHLNVHFYGDKALWIDNNLAKIPLELDIFLRGTLNNPLLFGRVEAPKGTVHFRQNDFMLTSASAEFLNPERIDPLFNVKAKTSVKNNKNVYAIDMILTGTRDRFNLTLSSVPSLSEPDILALLTVGKTTEEINLAGVGKEMGSEAVSFIVSDFLEEPVRSFGVDRIHVDTRINDDKGSPTPRVTVGKRLMGDRLVVTYRTSLDTTQEQLVRMEYEVSDNVSLVGQQDEDGIGGDIRFRFEFR